MHELAVLIDKLISVTQIILLSREIINFMFHLLRTLDAGQTGEIVIRVVADIVIEYAIDAIRFVLTSMIFTIDSNVGFHLLHSLLVI